MTRATLRLGWFSTGRGEGSLGLLNAALAAIDSGALDARVEFVFCNRERDEAAGSDAFLSRVEGRGIHLVAFSSKKFREAHGGRPWPQLRSDYDLAGFVVGYLLGRRLPSHRWMGRCPDMAQPEANDPRCPACRIIAAMEAQEP